MTNPAPMVHSAMLAPAPGPQFWDAVKKLLLDGVSSSHTRRSYGKALDDFQSWYEESGAADFTKATVQAYRGHLENQGLAPSTINVRLSALRKLAEEAADAGLLPLDRAAAIVRVKGVKQLGVRAGNWLTREQAQTLLSLPSRKTNRGKRDRVILALLIGGAIRREELATLEIERIQQRDGRWCVVDLVGKGKRVRTVPIPAWAKTAIDEWLEAAGFTSGRLLAAVNKGDRIVGQRMSAQGIYNAVLAYQEKLQALFAPHDLRRTHAKLAYQGGAELKQIQEALGHATIQTTEKYVGAVQDLTDAPCDHLKLRVRKRGCF